MIEIEDIDSNVSAAVMAEALGVTTRHLARMAKDGVIKKEARSKYNFKKCLADYISFLKEENKSQTRNASENRLRDARAKEVELRIAVTDRTVISLHEAEDIVDKMAGIYLQSILGLPAAITRNIDERKRIEKICDRSREKIAKRFQEIGNALQTGIDTLDTFTEDDT